MPDILDDHLHEKKLGKPKSIKSGQKIASNYDRFAGHLIDLLCIFPVFIIYIITMEQIFGEIKEWW